MAQSKEAKRQAAVQRNERHRGKYVEEAGEKGITDPDQVKAFADQKIGIRKQDR